MNAKKNYMSILYLLLIVISPFDIDLYTIKNKQIDTECECHMNTCSMYSAKCKVEIKILDIQFRKYHQSDVCKWIANHPKNSKLKI